MSLAVIKITTFDIPIKHLRKISIHRNNFLDVLRYLVSYQIQALTELYPVFEPTEESISDIQLQLINCDQYEYRLKQLVVNDMESNYFEFEMIMGEKNVPELLKKIGQNQKRKMRNGDGHHLYYMCQAYHSKGLTACRTNLVDKHLIEEQVLKVIHGVLNNQALVEQILNKAKSERSYDTSELNFQLSVQEKELERLNIRKSETNQSFISGDIEATAYNEITMALVQKIEDTERIIHNLNVEIEKRSSKYNITEAMITDALQNFATAFEHAGNEEKKQLIKALIKKIEVEPDRKRLKSIVFWFSEDDALPLNDTRRTVS